MKTYFAHGTASGLWRQNDATKRWGGATQYETQILAQDILPRLFNAGFELFFSNFKTHAPYENDFIFVKSKMLSNRDLVLLNLICRRGKAALALAGNVPSKLGVGIIWIIVHLVMGLARHRWLRRIIRL